MTARGRIVSRPTASVNFGSDGDGAVSTSAGLDVVDAGMTPGVSVAAAAGDRGP